jgi:hypothetical protein
MHTSLIVATVSPTGANTIDSTGSHSGIGQSDSQHTQFQLHSVKTPLVLSIHDGTSRYSELQRVLTLSGVTVTTNTTSETINTSEMLLSSHM